MSKTPDFRHLVLRNMVDYLKGRGFPTVEANKRAEKLMQFVDREAAKFAADELTVETERLGLYDDANCPDCDGQH